MVYNGSVGTPKDLVTLAGVNGTMITNLKAGTLSASSTDAINGSQLYTTNQNVASAVTSITALQTDALQWNTSLGAYDASHGGVTAQRITNVAAGTAATDAVNKSQLDAVSTDVSGLSDRAVVYNGSVGTPKDLVTLAGVNGTMITNLKAGTLSASSTDAVNGSQLYGVSQSMATILGGGSTVAADGTLTAPTYVINQTSYHTVSDAFGAVDANLDAINTTLNTINNGGGVKYFRANATGADSQAIGSNSLAMGPAALASGNNSVAAGTAAQAVGASSIAIGQNASANYSGDVALGAGSITQAAVQTSTMTVNGTVYAVAGTATSTVSMGAAGAERTITNVAAGRVNATSTDVVNGSQLYATNMEIQNAIGSIGTLNKNAVQYDTYTDGSKKNSVTLQGGDPNAPVMLSNVAVGVANTDAVNVGQLKQGLGNTLNDAKTYTDTQTNYAVQTANSYTDVRAQQTLSQANAYTDYRLANLNTSVNEVRTEARQAAAVGLAAASLRYDDRPGKVSAAVGAGAWHGEGAWAAGLGYTSTNQTVRGNLSVTNAGSNWGVGAGVSFTLN